jgi:hypothetical protein
MFTLCALSFIDILVVSCPFHCLKYLHELHHEQFTEVCIPSGFVRDLEILDVS